MKAILERQELPKAKYDTEKSQTANVLLTLFLGPIGLFYATPSCALILIIGPLLLMFVFVQRIPEILSSQVSFTIFLSKYLIIMIPLTWLFSLILGCIEVNKHNKRVSAKREMREQDRHIEQLEAIEKTRQAPREVDNQQTDDTESRSENPYY